MTQKLNINLLFYIKILSLLTPFLLCSCYSFSQTALPSHLKTMTVLPVQNQTTQSLVAEKMQRGVEDFYKNQLGGVRLVSQNGLAETRIVFKSYTNAPIQFNSSGVVSQYKVTLQFDFEIYDKIKDKALYSGKSLSSSGFYDISIGENEDQHGQERAIKNFKEVIAANALSSW
jgi:hypothetical protein